MINIHADGESISQKDITEKRTEAGEEGSPNIKECSPTKAPATSNKDSSFNAMPCITMEPLLLSPPQKCKLAEVPQKTEYEIVAQPGEDLKTPATMELVAAACSSEKKIPKSTVSYLTTSKPFDTPENKGTNKLQHDATIGAVSEMGGIEPERIAKTCTNRNGSECQERETNFIETGIRLETDRAKMQSGVNDSNVLKEANLNGDGARTTEDSHRDEQDINMAQKSATRLADHCKLELTGQYKFEQRVDDTENLLFSLWRKRKAIDHRLGANEDSTGVCHSTERSRLANASFAGTEKNVDDDNTPPPEPEYMEANFKKPTRASNPESRTKSPGQTGEESSSFLHNTKSKSETLTGCTDIDRSNILHAHDTIKHVQSIQRTENPSNADNVFPPAAPTTDDLLLSKIYGKNDLLQMLQHDAHETKKALDMDISATGMELTTLSESILLDADQIEMQITRLVMDSAAEMMLTAIETLHQKFQ